MPADVPMREEAGETMTVIVISLGRSATPLWRLRGHWSGASPRAHARLSSRRLAMAPPCR